MPSPFDGNLWARMSGAARFGVAVDGDLAMRWFNLISAIVIGLGLGPLALSAALSPSAAAETTVVAELAGHAESAAAAHEEAHGLTQRAPILLDLGFFQVTNSMLVTWLVALGLIIFARVATRRIQTVPDGAQNFWEWMVESLHDFLGGIIGHELLNKTFWFFATVFIFVLFTNWFGLLPGVGTIGWGHADANGHMSHIATPLLRGGNADLNMTSAMSIIFFACWIVWALQANGPTGVVSHIFGYRGDATGALRSFLILVFVLVGLLEVISILFRPVSLSFRLYGNIFAGENLLEAMSLMGGKYLGWLVPLPFYFLEVIVGFVQALVFMLLTAIFTSLICSHDDDHEAQKKAHGAGHRETAH